HGGVSCPQRLEVLPLRRDRAPAPRVEERRLELPHHALIAGWDGIVVSDGGDELDRAHLLEATPERPVRRELEDLPVRLGELAERLAPPLLEVGELLLVLLARPLRLLPVPVVQGAQRVLVALVGVVAALLCIPRAADPLVLHLRPGEELGVAPEQDVRAAAGHVGRSEEHTSELQSLAYLVCR